MRSRGGATLGRRVACLVVALTVLPAAAHAAPSRSYAPASLTETLATPHFLLHFTTAAGADQADPTSVSKLAARAEGAYNLEVGTWGFPPPPSDGDGKTDVYVHHITYTSSQFNGEPLGLARRDAKGDQTTAALEVQPFAAENPDVIGHEFFHVIQFGIYSHESAWFVESSATWAGNNAGGVARFLGAYATPEISLDCVGVNVTDCGNDARGYSRWGFWEALFERYGPSFVLDSWKRAAVLGAADHGSHALQAISDALAARGVGVTQAFIDYTADLLGGLKFAPLAGKSPKAQSTVDTGSTTATLPPQTVTINHLASAYLRFSGPAGSSVCRDATLRVAVTGPAGVPFQPVFRSLKDDKQPVVRLPVAGTTAVGDIPWSTCNDAIGKLGIQNASPTADAQPFGISARLVLATTTRQNTLPRPALNEAAAGPPSPAILDFRAPARVKLSHSRKGTTTIRFSVRADVAGFASLTVFKKFINLNKPGLIEIADDPTQPLIDVKLRKGLNKLSLRITNKHKTGRFLLVVEPYSGLGINDLREEGTAASRAIHFTRR
jgi:hypothetical protein